MSDKEFLTLAFEQLSKRLDHIDATLAAQHEVLVDHVQRSTKNETEIRLVRQVLSEVTRRNDTIEATHDVQRELINEAVTAINDHNQTHILITRIIKVTPVIFLVGVFTTIMVWLNTSKQVQDFIIEVIK